MPLACMLALARGDSCRGQGPFAGAHGLSKGGGHSLMLADGNIKGRWPFAKAHVGEQTAVR